MAAGGFYYRKKLNDTPEKDGLTPPRPGSGGEPIPVVLWAATLLPPLSVVWLAVIGVLENPLGPILATVALSCAFGLTWLRRHQKRSRLGDPEALHREQEEGDSLSDKEKIVAPVSGMTPAKPPSDRFNDALAAFDRISRGLWQGTPVGSSHNPVEPPDGQTVDEVLAGDAALAIAYIAGADSRISALEQVLWNRHMTVQVESPSGGAPLSLGQLSRLTNPTPPGFWHLVDVDRQVGTTLAVRYQDALLGLVTLYASLDGEGSLEEAKRIGEMRAEMDRALANSQGGPPAPHMKRERLDPDLVRFEAQERMSLDELFGELDSLIGLSEVKREIRELADFIHIQNVRRRAKLPTQEITHHLVFTGNPGTGKTTVARILGQIYGVLGVVSQGHLVEVDRSQLVAGFVGQTAGKVRTRVEEALGGVLFIDEAYSLAGRGDVDYGHEAIATLVKLMEDYREDLAVIFAGYVDPMQTLMESNPGLESRVRGTIAFPDFTDDELVAIFRRFCETEGYEPTAEAETVLRRRLAAAERGPGFGNARLARNIFEGAITRQASRLVRTGETSKRALSTLVGGDLLDLE